MVTYAPTNAAVDPRAWGRQVENAAIAMWTAITDHPAIRLDDYAKVDALFLPHLATEVRDDAPITPYFLEVHGRHSPLIDAPQQRVGMKAKVYDSLVTLAKTTKMPIIWVVVGPDCILDLAIPAAIDGVAAGRVYFDAARFGKLESPVNRKFFEGLF